MSSEHVCHSEGMGPLSELLCRASTKSGVVVLQRRGMGPVRRLEEAYKLIVFLASSATVSNKSVGIVPLS